MSIVKSFLTPHKSLKQSYCKRLFAVSLIILISLIITYTPPSSAQTNNTLSAWARSTSTIDGKISKGEWDDAASVNISLYNLADKSVEFPGKAVLYVKNDKDNIYFALVIEDKFSNDCSLNFFFDNNSTGVLKNGDDCLNMGFPTLGWDRFRDLYYSIDGTHMGTTSDTNNGGTNNARA